MSLRTLTRRTLALRSAFGHAHPAASPLASSARSVASSSPIPKAQLQVSPATSGFPCTTDLQASPFYDAQTGPTRTMLPVFDSLEDERSYRKEHLALVFRILHRFKMAEGIAGM